MKKRISFDYWNAITLITLVFFILFFLFPVLQIFIQSVYDSASCTFSLDSFKKFFSRSYYTSTITNSFKVTIAATLITMVTGTMMAYFMKTVTIKARKIIDMIVIVSILSPPFIGAYSWIILLGRSGVLTKIINSLFGISFSGIYGFYGILLVFTVKMTPLMYLFVSGALEKIDSSIIECSENLGCHGVRKIRKIVLPLIMPTLLNSAFLVFMRIFCDFGTPMLIGEGYRTVPVLIYNSFIGEMGSDYSFASAMSVIVIAFSIVIFSLQQFVAQKSTIKMNSLHPVKAEKKKGAYGFFANFFCLFVALLSSLPLLVIVVLSFRRTDGIYYYNEFSFNSYIKAFDTAGSAIFNTFAYSIVAMLVILFIGVLFSYVSVRRLSFVTKVIDVIITMPYIIPGSVMGIALILGFNKRPFVLTGTAVIMIVAYIIRRMPYTIRSSSSILRQIDPSIEEAARSLGSSKSRAFWRITFPVMVPGVISGALMSWMSIITELSATVLLYTTRTQTISIAIYQEVIRGNEGVACALSTILLLTTVISLTIFFRLSGKREIAL